MSRSVCRLAALGLLWVGVVGFADSRPFGLHLTPVHNVIHLVTGFLAFSIGFGASTRRIRSLGLALGAAYTAFGVLGMLTPRLVGEILGVAAAVDAISLAPDNLLSVFVGSLFLLTAMAQTREEGFRRSYLA